MRRAFGKESSADVQVAVRAPQSGPSTHTPFWQLQRDAGNLAVARLFDGSPGVALPTSARHQFEKRLHVDLSQVRLHTDTESAHSVNHFGAAAYTFGKHIVLGSSTDLSTVKGNQLLAHELAHTVQQSDAANGGKLAMTAPAETMEHEAGRVACGGEPALSRAPLHIATDTPQQQEREAAATSTSQAVIIAMSIPNPVGGVGNFAAAYALLDPLSVAQLVQVGNQLQNQTHLSTLLANADSANGPNRNRVLGVLRLVRLARAAASDVQQSEVAEAANDLEHLTSADRDAALQALATMRGTSVPSRETIEGLAAMSESAASPASIPQAVQNSVAGGPIGPGPFTPPGGQPIPYYIGNQAHIGIAAEYVETHEGHLVFTNYFPMSTIVPSFHRMNGTPNMVSNLTGGEQALKPDIANWQRRHLYEIKPVNSQTVAAAEALMYQQLFARAGLMINLGPSTEPGTTGAIPAPAGVYLFTSPQAGVITYQYRRGQLDPVPLGSPETDTSPRWVLRPLTPQQKKAIVTTGGVVTVGTILMYILEYGWILAL